MAEGQLRWLYSTVRPCGTTPASSSPSISAYNVAVAPLFLGTRCKCEPRSKLRHRCTWWASERAGWLRECAIGRALADLAEPSILPLHPHVQPVPPAAANIIQWLLRRSSCWPVSNLFALYAGDHLRDGILSHLVHFAYTFDEASQR